MKREQELDLIEKAGKGDEDAFELLVLANQKIVYNLALRNLRDPEDALDVSQEVFIKAFTALGSFRGDSRFSVWLYRLTQNACADFARKNRRGGVLSLSGDDEGDIDIPDGGETPEEAAERSELQAAVRDAVDALPAASREILLLREFAGLGYAEIAEALHINEGTVKSRLARAREALAELVRGRGTIPVPAASNRVKGGGGHDGM